MATVSIEKLVVNIPQLKSEKDWQVWKFQVTHALKAAELWGYVYVTETVEEPRDSQKQKAFYCILQCIGQKYICANGHGLCESKANVGYTVAVL